MSRLRVFRIAVSSLILLSALFGAFYFFRTPEGLSASATDHYDERFPAGHAVDGDPGTEWLLPNGTQGTLEVTISPPRDLTQVRILNGHNPPHNDRAARAYRLELYSDGEVVQTLEGELAFSPRPEWVTHEVDQAGVDEVHLIVTSWYRDGAAIAEVEVQ